MIVPQAWHQSPDLPAAFSRTAVDRILTLFGYVSLYRPLDVIGYFDWVDVLGFEYQSVDRCACTSLFVGILCCGVACLFLRVTGSLAPLVNMTGMKTLGLFKNQLTGTFVGFNL